MTATIDTYNLIIVHWKCDEVLHTRTCKRMFVQVGANKSYFSHTRPNKGALNLVRFNAGSKECVDRDKSAVGMSVGKTQIILTFSKDCNSGSTLDSVGSNDEVSFMRGTISEMEGLSTRRRLSQRLQAFVERSHGRIQQGDKGLKVCGSKG